MRKKQYQLYDLPEQVKKIESAGNALWTRRFVILLLVIFLSALDYVTIRPIFGTFLIQSAFTNIVIAAGCAVALNFIPLVAARFIHCWRYRINGVKVWMIVTMLALFLAIFSATFYMRWECRANMFTIPDDDEETVTTVDPNSEKAISVTILLGFLPLITSGINLSLGYITDDPVQQKLYDLKYRRACLAEQLDIMRAAAQELNIDWDATFAELEDKRLNAACEEVRCGSNQIRSMARFALAEKLGDADSISELTDSQAPDQPGTTDTGQKAAHPEQSPAGEVQPKPSATKMGTESAGPCEIEN